MAEDGVLAVEMGRAALLAVGPEHLGGNLRLAVGGSLHLLADGLQLVGAVGLPPDYVELTGAALTLRVGAVALARHGDGTSTVVVCGCAELGLQGVAQVAVAQQDARLGVAALGVAGLDHEVFYHTVEEQRVVEVLPDQLDEVVAVDGRVVEKDDAYVALGGLQEHLALLGEKRGGRQDEKGGDEDCAFHCHVFLGQHRRRCLR